MEKDNVTLIKDKTKALCYCCYRSGLMMVLVTIAPLETNRKLITVVFEGL